MQKWDSDKFYLTGNGYKEDNEILDTIPKQDEIARKTTCYWEEQVMRLKNENRKLFIENTKLKAILLAISESLEEIAEKDNKIKAIVFFLNNMVEFKND